LCGSGRDIEREALFLETESALIKPIVPRYVSDEERFGWGGGLVLVFEVSPEPVELLEIFLW
jgi:hypothetical protein